MYAQGLGVGQDLPEAIRHFEAVAKPSDSGDAFPARIELGRIFSHGLGVPSDTNMALKWYASAIEVATDTDDPEEKEEVRKYLDNANNSQ
jgi:TPR repeat protein